mmetsp:Transcript_38711/g.84211  ORF Transcript_38711/g.84211 Transcript_38711/m.84211 type:complete len:225 (-) Transcript_38711:482-1156(-)
MGGGEELALHGLHATLKSVCDSSCTTLIHIWEFSIWTVLVRDVLIQSPFQKKILFGALHSSNNIFTSSSAWLRQKSSARASCAFPSCLAVALLSLLRTLQTWRNFAQYRVCPVLLRCPRLTRKCSSWACYSSAVYSARDGFLHRVFERFFGMTKGQISDRRCEKDRYPYSPPHLTQFRTLLSMTSHLLLAVFCRIGQLHTESNSGASRAGPRTTFFCCPCRRYI